MYKVYSFLISLYPPRAPRRKKLCANREVKGVKGVKGVKELRQQLLWT